MKRKIHLKNPRHSLEMEFFCEIVDNINYVRRNPDRYQSLMDDKEFIIRAMDRIRGNHLELFLLLNDQFKNDRNLAIKALEKNGHILQHVSESLKDDELAVKAAIKNQGYAIKYASDRFKSNRTFALSAIKNNGHALEAISEELKDDAELVIHAVNHDGRAIEYASERLKNKREIALVAVENNGIAIKFLSKELKADKEIILAAIKSSNKAEIFSYLNDSIKNDKELALSAYKRNKHSIRYFTQDLYNELEGKDVISYLETAILKEQLDNELSTQDNKTKKMKL